jgi:glucose-1-phosphate cytidylyltransferase
VRELMKAVILAGGFGTRLSEETTIKPKPMVEIGGYPMLWHIMKIYSHYGVNDFIICLGYKGYMIKEYFLNYFLHQSDVTFNMKDNTTHIHNHNCEPWKVTLVDTGEGTMTGGRLKKIKNYLNEETFCFTYGDGISNINIIDLIAFHKENKGLATVTAVKLPARFGSMELDGYKVTRFKEKPEEEGSYVNGGFFVLEPSVLELIEMDSTVWEKEPLEIMAKEGTLRAFKHNDFWMPMDTLRDKNILEDLWNTGKAPWKVW